MYQPVTVQATRRIADEFNKDVVVIVALDHAHDKTHFSSYGQAPHDKIQAANLAAYLAQQMGCLLKTTTAAGSHSSGNPVESYADFRTKDAAVRAQEIDRCVRLLEEARQHLPESDLRTRIDEVVDSVQDSP